MTPDRAWATCRRGRWITTLGLMGLAGVFVRALAFTPLERLQGPAQKIYYIHPPAAWCALLAFSLTGVLGLLYLWIRDRRIDLAAEASAEVGVVFAAIVLTTGPIWGKPIWGTWWTWDARLTSTLFVTLLFVGYLVMRRAVSDPDLRARYSAIIGVMGIVLVGFVHLSVELFRTLHPQPIVLKPSAPSLPSEMLHTLLLSFLVNTLLYFGFVMQRYGIGTLRELKAEEDARGS